MARFSGARVSGQAGVGSKDPARVWHAHGSWCIAAVAELHTRSAPLAADGMFAEPAQTRKSSLGLGRQKHTFNCIHATAPTWHPPPMRGHGAFDAHAACTNGKRTRSTTSPNHARLAVRTKAVPPTPHTPRCREGLITTPRRVLGAPHAGGRLVRRSTQE